MRCGLLSTDVLTACLKTQESYLPAHEAPRAKLTREPCVRPARPRTGTRDELRTNIRPGTEDTTWRKLHPRQKVNDKKEKISSDSVTTIIQGAGVHQVVSLWARVCIFKIARGCLAGSVRRALDLGRELEPHVETALNN